MKNKAKIIIPILLVLAVIIVAVILLSRRKREKVTLSDDSVTYLQIYKLKKSDIGTEAEPFAYVVGAKNAVVSEKKIVTAWLCGSDASNRELSIEPPTGWSAQDLGVSATEQKFIPVYTVETTGGYKVQYTDCYILKDSIA